MKTISAILCVGALLLATFVECQLRELGLTRSTYFESFWIE